MSNIFGAILAGMLILIGLLNNKPFFNSPDNSGLATPTRIKIPAVSVRDNDKKELGNVKNIFSSLGSSSGDYYTPKQNNKKVDETPKILPIDNNQKTVEPETVKENKNDLEKVYSEYLPVRNWNVSSVEIGADAVLSADENIEKIFYQKNISKRVPIASLTKLMTAIVVLDNYNLEEKIKISSAAVRTEGEMGGLIVGEEITVKNLLYVMLIESSNDAAFAFAEKTGVENFIGLMNKKSVELDLKNTYFANPAGLDNKNNYSTAFDLARITSAALRYPQIWEILRTQEINVKSEKDQTNSSSQIFSHRLINSNKLLSTLSGVTILGGKTGYTDLAGGCMILVVQFENFRVINIVLGADGGTPFLDRFKETEKLVNWLKIAYIWK